MKNTPDLKIQTLAEILIEVEKHKAEMDRMFSVTAKTITINRHYPYVIELSRIPDFQGLLEWVDHLGGKAWMDRVLIREFIRRVCEVKGWVLHRDL
jgi:hypothetical protein